MLVKRDIMKSNNLSSFSFNFSSTTGAIAKAEQIVNGLGADGMLLQQFNNPDNPKIHRETTGPEIWRDVRFCFCVLLLCLLPFLMYYYYSFVLFCILLVVCELFCIEIGWHF